MQFEVACNPAWMALNTLTSLDEDDSTFSIREVSILKEANRLFAYCVANKINYSSTQSRLFEDKDLNELIKTTFLFYVKPLQLENGSFTWTVRGREDLFTTIYVLTQLGRLKELNAVPDNLEEEVNEVINKGIQFCDTSIAVRKNQSDLTDYVYMRSYFKEAQANKNYVAIYNLMKKSINQPANKLSERERIEIAIAFARNGDRQLAKQLFEKLKKLKDPLLLQLAHDAGVDVKNINSIIISVLQQKERNSWTTDFETVNACYAILLNYKNALPCEPLIHIKSGSIAIYNTKPDTTGNLNYFNKLIDGRFIKPEMGKVSLSIPNFKKHQNKMFASINWEYYDQSKPKINISELQIKKALLNSKLEKTGEVHKGDIIVVRLELIASRDLDHIQISNITPAGLTNPTRVRSPKNEIFDYTLIAGNKNMKVFIPYLMKGQYVIEYKMIANYTGSFNNGITTADYPSAKETIKLASTDAITIE